MGTTGNWLPLASDQNRPEATTGDYIPQVRRQAFAHRERLFWLDFDLIASWTWSVWSIWRRTCLQIGRRRNHHGQVHNQCTDVVAAPRTDSERPPNMKLVSTTVVNIVAEIRANISFKVMRLLQQWLVVSNAWPSSIRLIQGVSKNTEFYQIEHFQICHKYHKYFFPTGSRISKSSIW